jgi:hypothetical protein
MTKHRILIEFESDKLPDDFTDQVAGRVYGMPCVNKVECTATLLDDFVTRGVLASLKCWHRLTGEEVEEIVTLFQAKETK